MLRAALLLARKDAFCKNMLIEKNNRIKLWNKRKPENTKMPKDTEVKMKRD